MTLVTMAPAKRWDITSLLEVDVLLEAGKTDKRMNLSKCLPSWQWYSHMTVTSFSRIIHQCKNCSGMVRGTSRIQGGDLASKFPGLQSDQAPVRYAGKTSLIHRGPTSQLKGSDAHVSVPDGTGCLQKSCGVNALT